MPGSPYRLLCSPDAKNLDERFAPSVTDVVVTNGRTVAFGALLHEVAHHALSMSAEEALEAVARAADLPKRPQPFGRVVLSLLPTVTPETLHAWAVFSDLVGADFVEVLVDFGACPGVIQTRPRDPDPTLPAATDEIFARAGFTFTGMEGGMRRYARSEARRSAAKMQVSVLENDKKTAVYKVALMKALTTVATRTPACVRFLTLERTRARTERFRTKLNLMEDELCAYAAQPFAEVPFLLVLEAMLEDFWRIWAPERKLNFERPAEAVLRDAPRQIGGARTPGFALALNDLMRPFAAEWEAFRTALSGEKLCTQDQALYETAVKDLALTVTKGPVQYAGSSLYGKTGFFRIFSTTTYEDDRRAAKTLTGWNALAARLGWLQLPAELWAELRSSAPWLSDSLIMRWGRESARLSRLAKDLPPATLQNIADPGLVITRLLAEEAERDVVLAKAIIRDVMAEEGDVRCVWTGERLTDAELAIDHMLPFSKLRSNDLWNLAPTRRDVNLRKSDKLPTQKLLVARKPTLQTWWREADHRAGTLFAGQVRHALPGIGTMTPGHADLELVFDGMLAMTDMVARQFQCQRWEP